MTGEKRAFQKIEELTTDKNYQAVVQALGVLSGQLEVLRQNIEDINRSASDLEDIKNLLSLIQGDTERSANSSAVTSQVLERQQQHRQS